LAGSAGQKSFGGGVAAGAGGVLAQQQQQKENARADQQQANSNQEAQDEHTKSQAQTAQAYAAMANTIHQTALLPTDRQAAILDARTQQTEDLRKNGSMVPAGQPTTHEDVLQQVAQLHATNPTHFYSPEPIKGDDGKVQWQAMESPDVPLQEDAKLYLPDGSTRTVPKGSITVKQLAQAQQLALNQQVTNMSTKAQAAKTTAEEAKAGTNDKAGAMLIGSLPDGTQVAGSPDQLKQWGAQGVSKLPAQEIAKTIIARQLIAPTGLFKAVSEDIQALENSKQLGVAATKWSNFMAGDVGKGPEFSKLRTDMGLLGTALMQAHVGSRGSKDMIEHFTKLADYRIDDAPTLKAALSHEWNYVHEKAMLPPKTVGVGVQ